MGKNPAPLITSKDKTTFVTLKIQGPKSLISRELVKTVSATITWKALLNDQLKLELPLDQGIYICNPGHARNTKSGPKWRCELNDEVRLYVNHYSRDKEYYVACIRRPDTAPVPLKKTGQTVKKSPPKSKLLQKTSTAVPQDKLLMPPPPPPPPRRGVTGPVPRVVPSTRSSTRRASGSTKQESVANGTPKLGNVRTLSSSPADEVGPTAGVDREEMEVDDGGGGGDAFSVITSASAQTEELRRLGIPMEDIKSLVARRLDRYPNGMLLRMRDEMQTLIRGGTWLNIVQRAPLNANFLRDLLSREAN